MAIDDNTSYELTGYQVKDLAQKIRAKADSSSLASVATSGLYSDLTGKPTIPTVYNGELTITQNGVSAGTFTANQSSAATIALTDTTYSDFTGTDGQASGTAGLVPAPTTSDTDKYLKSDGTWATVATGGTYTAGNGINIDANDEISIDTSVVAELSDLPTQTSDLANDGSDGTSTYVEADELATVATSGDYSDLINTPVIPAAQVNSDWNANSGVSQILNKPSLAAVATSGNYSDLSGTPTIPTVNDATLTIQQNGTSVGTFTANASSNATISLTDTTYSAMTGATSGAAGASGLVPAPAAGDNDKYLKGDGTWGTVSSGATYTAGNGISIDANNEIAIDTSVVAELSDIPTVNNGTLTIQHNGSNVQTFTANQSTNATANIETIYSVDVSSTQPITQVVSTSMIQDEAVTMAKIDLSTNVLYSNTERVIGANAAGKPIYAKTFSTNAPSQTDTTTTVATMPANTVPIRIYGTLFNSSVPLTIPLPGILSADNWFRLTVNPTSGAIQMGLHQGSYASNPCEITVEYTKTTD